MVSPIYTGEAMLVRWVDSSQAGMTVTFALHPDECGTAHPFRGLGTGKHGQRFALVAVPIGDDEQPMEEPAPTVNAPAPPAVRSDEHSRRPFHALPRSQQAGIACKDARFREWLITQHDLFTEEPSEAVAAYWIRVRCGVCSRAELDHDQQAADKWDSIYAQYLSDTGRAPEIRSTTPRLKPGACS